VLKVACLREVKVEDYLVALVWLQGKVLALYVLGQLEGDCALGHLVKKVESLGFRRNICDDDLALVGGSREELIRFAGLFLCLA